MKCLSTLLPLLLCAGLLPGCLENPLFDDEYCGSDPPLIDIPPQGPPNVTASATVLSAIFVTGHGGAMTASVRATNAQDVGPAYDIQADIIVVDGSGEIGGATVYLGDLNPGEWTETQVDLSIAVYPRSAASLTIELTWWDKYDNSYQKHIGGYWFL